MRVSGPSGVGYASPSGRGTGARRKVEEPVIKANPQASTNNGGESMQKQPPRQHRKDVVA